MAIPLKAFYAPWKDKALCKGSSLFKRCFNSNTSESGEIHTAAKKVCLECPVSNDCRQYAFENNERTGVWGGLSGNQLRKQGLAYRAKKMENK